MSSSGAIAGGGGGERRDPRTVAAPWLAALAIVVLIPAYFYLLATQPKGVPESDLPYTGLFLGLIMCVGATCFAVVGALIMRREPANAVGPLLLLFALAFGLNGVSDQGILNAYFSGYRPSWLFVVAILDNITGFIAVFFVFAMLVQLFPDGRPLSPRWGWFVRLTIVSAVAVCVSAVFEEPLTLNGSGTPSFHNPLSSLVLKQVSTALNFFGPVVIVGLAAGIVSMIVRYRRGSPEVRLQLKWVLAAMTTLPVLMVYLITIGNGSGPTPPVVGFLVFAVPILVIPISIGFAVLKYRLYEIDIVLNRALVYGSLAVAITVLYLGTVVGIGSLVGRGTGTNLLLSLAATAVLAFAFQPARTRLQRYANRLVYGERANPYEVLSELSRRVSDTYSAESLLPEMARVLGEGTGASQATVWLRVGDHLQVGAVWPAAAGGVEPIAVTGQLMPLVPAVTTAVPVRHGGELLGALTLVKKSGDKLTPMEEKLVQDLGDQAGLVLRNFALTAELLQRLDELRASRQRLVVAQDEERRRLERNLHDGAQQNLVALKVKVAIARRLAATDPARAAHVLEDVEHDAGEALDTLRDLARGIYPPLLAEQGLGAALTAQARKATIPVTVDAPIGRYPQELEAAVYFCILEALQNVQKYAGATSATVCLTDEAGRLTFEVTDNGKGFDPAAARRGAGMQNMSDRVDSLGGRLVVESSPGRTRVGAVLPVAAESPPASL